MIHPTSIVDKNSLIAENVQIGPYCIIGPNVQIGDNSVLHSHVYIAGNTKIGKNNEIFPFVTLGTDPQDLKYRGEKNSILIGDNNKLREYVNINPGTSQGGAITKIGNNNLLMVYLQNLTTYIFLRFSFRPKSVFVFPIRHQLHHLIVF